MNQNLEQRQDRLPVVNGLRGIACLSVFYMHSLSGYTPPGYFGGKVGEFSISLGHVLSSAWFGVNLFFVLSGFVLYLPFADGKSLHIPQYYWRRLVRLMPLYYFVTITCILVFRPSLASFENLWLLANTILGTFFFVPSAGEVPGNSPLWSISIEIWLSAALPLLIWGIRRMGVAWLLLLIVLATTAFRYWGLSPEHHQDTLAYRFAVYADTLCEFAFGIYAAHCYVSRTAIMRFAQRHAALVLWAGVLGLAVFFHLHAYGRDFSWPRQVMAFHGLLLNPSLFTILIAALASAETSLIQRALSVYPLRLIGMMCFSIYVWHMPALLLFGETFKREGFLAALPYVIAEFASVFVVAFLTYRYIEFPRRRLRDVLGLDDPKPKTAGTTSANGKA
jgi:peptidoglycan/LPS O-acetylase OafA/YrhL